MYGDSYGFHVRKVYDYSLSWINIDSEALNDHCIGFLSKQVQDMVRILNIQIEYLLLMSCTLVKREIKWLQLMLLSVKRVLQFCLRR